MNIPIGIDTAAKTLIEYKKQEREIAPFVARREIITSNTLHYTIIYDLYPKYQTIR